MARQVGAVLGMLVLAPAVATEFAQEWHRNGRPSGALVRQPLWSFTLEQLQRRFWPEQEGRLKEVMASHLITPVAATVAGTKNGQRPHGRAKGM